MVQAVTASTVPDDPTAKLLALEERLYAPVEVAYILGIQQTTVQKLCREGRILAIKPGRSWRISKDEIKRYMNEGPREV